MLIREEHLIKLNNKNKIQHVYLKIEYDDLTKYYHIKRITGQFGGKETEQPVITITAGKVKRTVAEQATLQFLSQLKGYVDSGYKKLSSFTPKKYSELTEPELKGFLGDTFTTDASGIPKPMLAKSYQDLNSNVFDKEHYCSRKLDGVRSLVYYKDGKLHSASRGGGSYDPAIKHILEDKELIEIFKKNPKLILDGEIYHHGSDWPLPRISGLARQKEWKEECGLLEYWVYDYVSDEPFKDRYKFLMSLKSSLSDTSKIKICDHYKLTGWLTVKRWHDKFVKEGFEGLCARNPEKEYGVGKRSGVYLIKLKEFQTDEFEITGIRDGLRPEDMCFTLKTKSGKEFAAKPACEASTRIYYLNHKEEFIGKMATCKYFYYSPDGVPLLPVFEHIRPDDE